MMKTLKSLSIFRSIAAIIVTGTLLSCIDTRAQIAFSAGLYRQSFDSLAGSGTANTWTENSTLPGWYAAQSAGSGVTAYRADIGAGNTGALYSFGSADSSDRALGSISSGTPVNIAYGVRFANDTTDTVTNITLTYTGEQWRNGGNTAQQTLAFSYRVSNSPITSSDPSTANSWTTMSALSFTSPTTGATSTALDGNASANRQLFSAIELAGVSVAPGQEIFLRWLDINDSGNDHGLAVDDLSVGFNSIAAVTNPPSITSQPQSRTNNAGTVATFTVAVDGTALNYQWRLNDADLIDGIKVHGSTSPTLTVSGLLAIDGGDYTVFISNGSGSVTSMVATLTVIDPAIATQPGGHPVLAGDTGNLFAGAAGTVPLSYQWRFKGDDIADATTASLNVTNFQAANQGSYTLVVTNNLGSTTTSSPAILTLLATPSNVISRWDFNATNSLATNAPAPSIGSGTASLVEGAVGSFASGTFSDPAGAPGPANSGWNSATYATQGTSNKVRGVQFNVSTVGYQDVLLTWEERHSDTASKYTRLLYSTDGITFVDGPVFTMTATNNSFVFYSADLSSISSINNNPSVTFRIVPEWEATAIGNNNSNFVATVTSYNPAGTIRFDLMTAFGNASSAVAPIPLNIQQSGNSITLTWSNPAFRLQSASDVNGPYSDVSGASSGYSEPISGAAQFFRLLH
jgi:hypothetical protein